MDSSTASSVQVPLAQTTLLSYSKKEHMHENGFLCSV